MGMYTKYNLIIPLKNDTPDEVINELKMILKGEEPKDGSYCLWLNNNSFYFTGTSNSKLLHNTLNYVLHIDCDTKRNYNEIDDFLNWIVPYAKSRGFLGYRLYEEDEEPTLIYIDYSELKVNYKNLNV